MMKRELSPRWYAPSGLTLRRYGATGVALAGVFVLAAIPPSGARVLAAPYQAEVGSGPNVTRTADACGPGKLWVAAGYARPGKWRPAHCAPNAQESEHPGPRSSYVY